MAVTFKYELRAASEDDWRCACQNVPSGEGFSPSTAEGWPIEPVEGEWDGVSWVCVACGAVYRIDTVLLEARLEQLGGRMPVVFQAATFAPQAYRDSESWAGWTWGEPADAPEVPSA